MSGLRFLVIPVVGMPGALRKDGAFIFLMRVVEQLIAQGHYCYVVVPQDSNLAEFAEMKGVMFVQSSLPSYVFDVSRTTIDIASIAEGFSYHYGRYVIDAAIVMTGQQALMVKMSLGAELKNDIFPVFCIEQGVSWFGSEPGYSPGGFQDQLHMLGSSYSHMIWVSARDKRMFLEKAEHAGIGAARLKELSDNGTVSAVPLDLNKINVLSVKKSKKVYTALFAARANATKHPEIILSIFDELYKQGEPINVVFMTQTAELKATIYTDRHKVFDERQYIQKMYNQGVPEFYEQAAKSHIFLCWSDSESYNVSAGEAALLGNVFLCQDSKHHRELFGATLTDDRFWCVDYADAVEKVRWVIHHFDEAFALQKAFRDKYLEDTTTRHPAQIIEAITYKEVAKFKDAGLYKMIGLGDVFEKSVKHMTYPSSLQDVLTVVEKNSKGFRLQNLKRAISRRMPVNWAIHGYLRFVVGLKDSCSKRHPIYSKEK